MPGVSFRCGIDFVRARDALGNEVFVSGAAFLSGEKTIVSDASFECDASDLLKIRPDGSLGLRDSATVLESHAHTIYRAPWNILKMCVWIGGDYRFMGIFPATFTSPIFQWPAKPGSRQWRMSPFIGDRPTEEIEEEKRRGLLPGTLACPDEVRFPYALVTGKGEALFI